MGGTICAGMLTIRSLSTRPTCDGLDALESAASTERRDERVEWNADDEGSFERMYETSVDSASFDCSDTRDQRAGTLVDDGSESERTL